MKDWDGDFLKGCLKVNLKAPLNNPFLFWGMGSELMGLDSRLRGNDSSGKGPPTPRLRKDRRKERFVIGFVPEVRPRYPPRSDFRNWFLSGVSDCLCS